MSAARHRWVHHGGCALCEPPTAVERCANCDVLRRTVRVDTSRVGVHTATFASNDVPAYSPDGGATWAWDKPVCTGKRAASTVAGVAS